MRGGLGGRSLPSPSDPQAPPPRPPATDAAPPPAPENPAKNPLKTPEKHRYEKYDRPAGNEATSNNSNNKPSDDPFENELVSFEQEIEDARAASQAAAAEKIRAAAAARNADVRRAKQRLLSEGVAAVNRKLKRGKGVTPQIIEDRQRRVKLAIERVHAIPDGLGGGVRAVVAAASAAAASSSSTTTALTLAGPSGALANPLHYKATEENDRFDGDWRAARERQDAALERIERGLGELAEVAGGVSRVVTEHTSTLDAVDDKLNGAAAALRGNNRRLAGVLQQVRTGRNFCVDFVLVAVLLGVATYLATTVEQNKKAKAAKEAAEAAAAMAVATGAPAARLLRLSLL